MSAPNFREIATSALRRGEARVLPIAVGGKQPLITWKDTPIDTASTEAWKAQAEQWIETIAAQFPNANACVIAKPEEFIYLDVDTYREFVAGFEKWSGQPFPETYTTSARDNRAQLHYRQTDTSRQLGNIPQFVADGIDLSVRQRNLYVLAEGSVHPTGSTYQQFDLFGVIEKIPDKLVEYIRVLRGDVPQAVDVTPNGPRVPRGQHDVTLLRMSRKLRGVGLEYDGLLAALIEIVEKRFDDYGSDYIEMCEKHAKSATTKFAPNEEGRALNAGIGSASTAVNSTGGTSTVARKMSSFTKKAVNWLWKGRIPFGTFTTISGDPDQGKSLLTLYVAAQLSKGEPMYGDDEAVPPSDTLLLIAEDDPESTLLPRLEAAGANADHVHLLESVMLDGKGNTIGERLAQLDQDLQNILGVLDRNPNIRLIIIDPISSFLGDTSMNKEQEVRRVLNPLLKEIQKRKIAVLLVVHFNKNSETRSAMDRVGGAKALVGLGRAAWTCVSEPKAEPGDGEPMLIGRDRHLFLKLKGNLAPSSINGLVYTIAASPVEVETDDGGKKMELTPYIHWDGKSDATANDVVIDGKAKRGQKVEDSLSWLSDHLDKTGGSAWSDDVIEAGEQRGYQKRSLQRHIGRLRLDVVRVGPHRQTQWVKPGAQLQPLETAPPVKKARTGRKAVRLSDVEPETVSSMPAGV